VRATPTAERSVAADATWYRDQLIDGIARPLLRNAVAGDGFYRPFLGRDWQPLAEQHGTLISQSRAIYVLAAAYEVSGDVAYKDAMVKLADFLVTRFANSTSPGVWASEVAPDGTVLDPSYHAYGHAQAMFALAHAYRSSNDQKYLDAALATWVQIDVPRIVEGKNPLFVAGNLGATMHLFEALLALERAAPSRLVLADLTRLADYIVMHFVEPQGGFFCEEQDPSGRAVKGCTIVVAHSAQMAFLLSRAVVAGLPDKYLDTANHAVDFVVQYGVRRPDMSLPLKVTHDGKVENETVEQWTQAELIRCLAHFARARGRADLQPIHDAAVGFAKKHLVDSEYGGWYEAADQPNHPKGNDWKVPYHETMMLTEELRLRGWKFSSGSEMLL